MKLVFILLAPALGCPGAEPEAFIESGMVEIEASYVPPLAPRTAPVIVPDGGIDQGPFTTGGCLTGDRKPRLVCRGAGEMVRCADGVCKCAPTAALAPLRP